MSESTETVWVTVYDRYGDPGDELIGSRAGLTHLRDTIDQALAKGEAKAEVGFYFRRVRVQSEAPRPARPSRVRRVLEATAFLVVAGAVVMLIGLGVLKLVELIRR